ncbi:MAG: alpha/beta fold hydrolase [Candidatus Hermodarchaeota archaeon]
MPFIENRGLKIHYKVEGSGSALVLIHGGLSSLEDWYDVEYVTQLKDDFKLILVDLRGHGSSEQPEEPAMYSYDFMVEDIVKVLDELDIDKVHVAGFSFGGWFVYGLAEAIPERLLSMIILDGVPGLNDEENLRFLLSNDEAFSGLAGFFPHPIRERLLKVDKEKYLLMVGSLGKAVPKILERINKLIQHAKTPCLVITSEYEGHSEDFELMKKTANSISDSVLITKKGFTHQDILIRSDEIIPHIKEFLNDLK